jgi:hypothetical protein
MLASFVAEDGAFSRPLCLFYVTALSAAGGMVCVHNNPLSIASVYSTMAREGETSPTTFVFWYYDY